MDIQRTPDVAHGVTHGIACIWTFAYAHWTRTRLRSKTKNHCLTVVGGMGKIEGVAMPCSMWCGDERGGEMTLSSIPYGDERIRTATLCLVHFTHYLDKLFMKGIQNHAKEEKNQMSHKAIWQHIHIHNEGKWMFTYEKLCIQFL